MDYLQIVSGGKRFCRLEVHVHLARGRRKRILGNRKDYQNPVRQSAADRTYLSRGGLCKASDVGAGCIRTPFGPRTSTLGGCGGGWIRAATGSALRTW